MKRSAAVFTIALAVGAMIFVPRAAARADTREEGPTEIKKCQTIGQPGSYKLVNNIAASLPLGGTADCLVITADFVTIDLLGFTISGVRASGPQAGSGILAQPPSGGVLQGIAVRNGSISDFFNGVNFGSAVEDSIVEGLRVRGTFGVPDFLKGGGIIARGIVKGNNVSAYSTGISATGTVTGNYARSNGVGIDVGEGSTVIGNTALNNTQTGLVVDCPSNVTDNTVVNSVVSIMLNGNGCTNTNNVMP
jgi:hypothetical protein